MLAAAIAGPEGHAMGTRGKVKLTGRERAALHARPLTRFSAACLLLARALPPRVSMGQLSFFMAAATADLRGAPVTYSEIKAALGERGDSIKTTYAQFLDPSRTYPDALGWLCQEVDQDDKRHRYLKLTPKGLEVIEGLLEALDVEA